MRVLGAHPPRREKRTHEFPASAAIRAIRHLHPRPCEANRCAYRQAVQDNPPYPDPCHRLPLHPLHRRRCRRTELQHRCMVTSRRARTPGRRALRHLPPPRHRHRPPPHPGRRRAESSPRKAIRRLQWESGDNNALNEQPICNRVSLI